MASGSMHRRGVSSSSSISSSVTNTLLPSEVAALALQHQFDWAAVGMFLSTNLDSHFQFTQSTQILTQSLLSSHLLLIGKALKADPWECWKTYETYSQGKTHPTLPPSLPPSPLPIPSPLFFYFSIDQPSPNGDSPLFSGPTHGPTPISSLADDVAAFLPFASSPSPLRSNPLAPPYDLLHHYHPPDPSSFTAAAAATAAATADHGENHSSSSTISNPISPPPPVLSPPVVTGGPSFLHHFPRPNSRARLPFPASSTTAITTTTPAASFLRSFSASSVHQPGLSPGGGGGGGEGQAHQPVSLPAGLQDSAYSNFSGMGGGGGGASTFLPGSESMSLSMLQSAMLDMPSLYLGQSTAFGAGASTFLSGGGSTLFPPGTGAAAGAGGGAGAGAGGLDGLPPPTAPPFVSSSPMLQPLPRGLGGPTPAIIPATIMEGSGTAEGGGSRISN